MASSGYTIQSMPTGDMHPIVTPCAMPSLSQRIWSDGNWGRIQAGGSRRGDGVKWNARCHENTLNPYRSRTGYGIYEATFLPTPTGGWKISPTENSTTSAAPTSGRWKSRASPMSSTTSPHTSGSCSKCIRWIRSRRPSAPSGPVTTTASPPCSGEVPFGQDTSLGLLAHYHRRWQAETCYVLLKSTMLDGHVPRSRGVPSHHSGCADQDPVAPHTVPTRRIPDGFVSPGPDSVSGPRETRTSTLQPQQPIHLTAVSTVRCVDR